MAAAIAAEPSLQALEAGALLRAIDDRLAVEVDDDARGHLERWRLRLELDLTDALLAA